MSAAQRSHGCKVEKGTHRVGRVYLHAFVDPFTKDDGIGSTSGRTMSPVPRGRVSIRDLCMAQRRSLKSSEIANGPVFVSEKDGGAKAKGRLHSEAALRTFEDPRVRELLDVGREGIDRKAHVVGLPDL